MKNTELFEERQALLNENAKLRRDIIEQKIINQNLGEDNAILKEFLNWMIIESQHYLEVQKIKKQMAVTHEKLRNEHEKRIH